MMIQIAKYEFSPVLNGTGYAFAHSSSMATP